MGHLSTKIKDTVTGRVVFQLVGRYASPKGGVHWDGQYLVAGYESGEVLILDFNHNLPVWRCVVSYHLVAVFDHFESYIYQHSPTCSILPGQVGILLISRIVVVLIKPCPFAIIAIVTGLCGLSLHSPED